MSKIEWYVSGHPVTDDVIDEFETNMGRILPIALREIVSKNNLGRPENDSFRYFDTRKNHEETTCLSQFRSVTNDLPSMYSISDGFPIERLLPFGEVGNGDLVCLDYDHKIPKVVVWHHSEINCASEVADNIDDFLDLLFVYED